jgi:hypothetical protein
MNGSLPERVNEWQPREREVRTLKQNKLHEQSPRDLLLHRLTNKINES